MAVPLPDKGYPGLIHSLSTAFGELAQNRRSTVEKRASRRAGLVGDGVACQHPGDLVHTLGDTHLYLNHLEQAELQLSRAPRPLPTLSLEGAPRDLFAIGAEHIVISGYDPHPTIKAPVAV